ncbi:MAG: TonB-dependent receptor [Bryobacteraceae bacterium]|nr:TonB-dependent receptor [Bryobacteraceae bacterium]MDW8376880.1 TonB-dependent receptor [Bryobacterales bacterium]
MHVRQQAGFVVLVGLIALLRPTATSQTITARLIGTVTDPSGAPVPDAEVTVTNLKTNQERQAKTNSFGAYELAFLPVGEYRMQVSSNGFQTARVERFELSLGQTARLDVSLTIGSVSESVTIEATSLSLQTENATLGTVIDRQKVAELPLNGRSFIQLALLMPGVNPVTPGSLSARSAGGSLGQAVGMNANGFRDNQNRYYYDGVEAMSLGSYSFSFSLSIDAIQEFKVETSTYSAATGAAPGGHVNLTTKSGTNQWHGQLWEFNRNDKLTALEPFQAYRPGARPPRLNRNQFGGNLGGPVRFPGIYNGKDRTFFFFNAELGRLITGTSGNRVLVPPMPYRRGDFSDAAVRIFDPLTGQPFPNNVIPASRINPITGGYLKWVPPPNFNEAAVNYISPAVSAPTNQNQYVNRIDHRLNNKNSLYGTYIYNWQYGRTVPTFEFDWIASRVRSQHASLTDTHVFSPTLVNELRLGWHRRRPEQLFGTSYREEYNIANQLGLPGVSKEPRNYGPPTFWNTGYTLPEVRYIGPANQHNQIWQVADNLSWTSGTHSLKFGGVIFRRNFSFDEAFNPRGTFTFDGRTTSGGGPAVQQHAFAAYLLGLATNATLSPDPFANRMNHWWYSVYAQDDWKVTRSLTLNLGLRYDFFQPPVERGKITNFELLGAVPGFIVSRQLYGGFPPQDNLPDTPGYPRKSLVFPDKNNFGPHVGFAWKTPKFENLVVRGGYGLYYTQEITNSFTVLTLNPPIVRNFSFDALFDRPLVVDKVFLGTGTAVTGQFGTQSVDPRLRDAYAQQWNLTIQKKLPAAIYFDIGYVGSKGTNLVIGYDGNRPIDVITPGPGVLPVAARRPFQGFAGMSVAKSIGNSTYHSLQMKGERRVSRGLSFIASYTWSKALSTMDQSTVGGGFFSDGVQNIFDLRGEKAPAAFDLRHRFSLAVIYDLGLWRNSSSKALRTVLGGWQLGTIVTEQTGFASNLARVGDTTGTGISSRPDRIADPILPRSARSRDRWFNTSAFAMPTPGRFGNSSRHPIYLPGLNNVDFLTSKTFAIADRHQLQFRAEFFNFLNHVNLGAPGRNLQVPATFGRITSAVQGPGHESGQRVIQLALKYSF